MSKTTPEVTTTSEVVQNNTNSAKNTNPEELFGYILIGSCVVILACILLFASYMLPMVMLESMVQGDTEKVIVSPFENYTPSEPYHVTKSCLWPIFYEKLENSFACDNSHFNSIFVNQTVYCPNNYGCMSRLEYPYVYCISLDLSCADVDVSADGPCTNVASMKKYDDYSKIISFNTNTTTAIIQLMAEIMMIITVILFAFATVSHYKNSRQLTKKKIAFPYIVLVMFGVTYLMIFGSGIVYLCLVDDNITSAGGLASEICFDSEAKEIFSAIYSRYNGTLVMFILSVIFSFVLVSPLWLMFGAFPDEIQKSSYQLDTSAI